MYVYSETENNSSKKEICLNHEVFCKNSTVLYIILTTPYIALYGTAQFKLHTRVCITRVYLVTPVEHF